MECDEGGGITLPHQEASALPPEGKNANPSASDGANGLPPQHNNTFPNEQVSSLPPEDERTSASEDELNSASVSDHASASSDERNSASESDSASALSDEDSTSQSEDENSLSSDDESTSSFGDADTSSSEEELDLPHPPAASPTTSVDLNFGGISVKFPYEPYESQKSMMQHMIAGINSGQNCLLESPTGTGKTAALLCASLAWLKNELEKNPDSTACVIYASRTHSQLQQVADQVKKTAYNDIPMVTLASRNQTCINSVARDSNILNEMCEMMRENYNKPDAKDYPEGSGNFPTCSFYTDFKDNGPKFQQYLEARQAENNSSCKSWDIEDLVEFSRGCSTCPYYEIAEMRKQARLVLCNYNHLLHPWIRKAVNLEVEDNIVIFDEAHNIESTCMDIASRKISLRKLGGTIIPALNEATEKSDIPLGKRDALRNIDMAFAKLYRWLLQYETARNRTGFHKLGGCEVLKIANPERVFSNIGFSPDRVQRLYRHMKTLKDEENKYGYDPLTAQFQVEGSAMHAMSSILYTFYTLFEEDPDTGEYKRLQHYTIDIVAKRNGNSYEIELSVLCLSPRVIFEAMESARSVVVTSGTLSPMESFSSELGLSFEQTLQARHVVSSDRIFATTISKHVNDGRHVNFDFTYEGLDDTFSDQSLALANLLLLICKTIRNGILVFFTSKRVLLKFKESWKQDGTLKRLSKLKDLFYEHKIAAKDFKATLDEFRSRATSKGAIMFAVLRGRISEGIDFADDQARAVVTVGIPFGPMTDLLIKRKRDYNDEMIRRHPRGSYISGWNWYKTNAFRALNQGLGRCLRHKEDWGALFMIDSRYDQSSYNSSVSRWVRNSMIRGPSFGQIKRPLKNFLSGLQMTTFTPTKKKARPIVYSDE